MTEPRLIAEIHKNSRETIRLELGEYGGRPTVNLRVWYDAGNGDMRPGNKGLTTSLDHLPALAEAFAEAYRVAVAEGRLHESGDGGRA